MQNPSIWCHVMTSCDVTWHWIMTGERTMKCTTWHSRCLNTGAFSFFPRNVIVYKCSIDTVRAYPFACVQRAHEKKTLRPHSYFYQPVWKPFAAHQRICPANVWRCAKYFMFLAGNFHSWNCLASINFFAVKIFPEFGFDSTFCSVSLNSFAGHFQYLPQICLNLVHFLLIDILLCAPLIHVHLNRIVPFVILIVDTEELNPQLHHLTIWFVWKICMHFRWISVNWV